MTEFKLPNEWCSVKFGDCIESSFTGLVRSAKEQGADNTYDYLKMNNLNFDGSFDLTNMVKVEATDSEVLKYSLGNGDFLFNTRNSVELVGKSGVFKLGSNKPILFNNNLLKVRFIKLVPEIVAHWFNSPIGKQRLRDITSATTSVAAIYQKQLIGLDIPIPPLAEQKVIADKLDSLLAQVETTKARLDRVPDILKRFRQSVLAAAVSGRLTEEWRECHSIEDSIHEFGCFDPKKIEEESELFHIPNTWSWQHLGDLVSVHNSVRVPLKKADRDKRSGEYAYYGAFGVIDDIDDFLFDGEFILLAEDGKNLESRQRPISLVASGKFWVNNHAHVLKAKTGVINHYLNIFLNSPVVMIDQFLTGQDQVKLNRKAMTLIPISTPSFEEQTEIVRRVEELFAFADNVEQKAQAATERVNKLTQSILAKAFRGELTADWRVANPDLISGENSAEVLLEKIKAEREALKPKKKTRAKKVKKV